MSLKEKMEKNGRVQKAHKIRSENQKHKDNGYKIIIQKSHEEECSEKT